jgi:hypothetical protein
VTVLVVLVLVLVGANNVRRAAVQSMTHDEAMTWSRFTQSDWSGLYERFVPNNHVLHTALVKVSVDTLGTSELSVRLPSVLGGFVLLALVFHLTRRARPPAPSEASSRTATLAYLAGVLFVVLSPFSLDYLSAARGYGLASAALLGVVLVQSRAFAVGDAPRGPLLLAALASFLAVAFNLAFLIPVLGLGCAFALAVLVVDGGSSRWRRAGRLFVLYALPAALAALAFFAPIIREVQRMSSMEHIGGVDSLRASVQSVVRPALFHETPVLPPEGLFVVDVAARVWVPLVVLCIGAFVLGLLARLRRCETLDAGERLVLVAGGGLLATVCLHVVGYPVGVPFPGDRVGLHFVLLFSLAGTTVIARLAVSGGWRRALGIVNLVVVGVLVLRFVVQLPVETYAVWRYDARNRELFDVLERERRPDGRPLEVVAVPFQHAEGLNFYRHVQSADWIAEVERGAKGRTGADRTYDLAVVAPSARALPQVQELVAEVVHEDAFTGTLVVRPRPEVLRRLMRKTRGLSAERPTESAERDGTGR